jgi:hypothetical protein
LSIRQVQDDAQLRRIEQNEHRFARHCDRPRYF